MRLMVSVISAVEAGDAIAGGAEILDIKNPLEGSLGAQSPDIIRDITELASGKIEISVAIGDLPNLPGTAALAALGAAACGANYIKAGLYGSKSESDARNLLFKVRQAVAGYPVSVIAAGYADFERAGTLDPACLPDIAASAGLHGILLDTAVKDGRNLFDFIGRGQLREIVERAHAEGLIFGAAGALNERHLAEVYAAGVDIVGVRTAVCLEDRRSGPLQPQRIRELIRDGALFSRPRASG